MFFIQVFGIVVGLVALVPVISGFITLAMNNKQERVTHLLLLLGFWACMTLFVVEEILTIVSVGLQLYDLYHFVFPLGVYFFIGLTIFLTLFVDATSRDSFDSRKLVILCILSTSLVIFSFLPDAIYWVLGPDGGPILDAIGFGTTRITPLLIGTISMTVFLDCVLIWHLVKINQEAPASLKRYSRMAVIGAIFCGILTLIALILGLAGLHLLFFGIGSYLVMISFVRGRNLAFIRPFHVARLVVFHNESGIMLFTKTWQQPKFMVNEDLFSAMLQGVSNLMQESMGRGNIREIILEEGILIVTRSQDAPISFILIADKSTRMLREALVGFARDFNAEFKALYDRANETTQFRDAEKLVKKDFSFVPE